MAESEENSGRYKVFLSMQALANPTDTKYLILDKQLYPEGT
jgi:hypothetical protein